MNIYILLYCVSTYTRAQEFKREINYFFFNNSLVVIIIFPCRYMNGNMFLYDEEDTSGAIY